MTGIDIVILIAVGIGGILGFIKGFIKQLASFVGLVAGLLTARALYASLADKLCPVLTDSITLAQIIAFILIWIAVPVGFSLIASLLTKALEAVSLGWVNRWLGACLGILKYMLLAGLLINVIEFADNDSRLISQTKKAEAVLYYPMKNFAGIFFPVIKKVAQQYIV